MRASPSILASLALASMAVSGCHHAAPDETFASALTADQRGDVSATLDFVTNPRTDAGARIVIAEGVAVALDVQLVSVSGGTLQGSLQSANPGVLQVIADDGNGYGFLGAGAGTTTLAIVVNGEAVQTIRVTVGAPPASSLPPSIDAGALFALQNMPMTHAGPPEAGDVDAAPAGDAAVDATVGDAAAAEASASDASALDGTGVDASADGDDTEGGPLEDAGVL